MTTKIISIEKETVVETNETQLAVLIELSNEAGDVIRTARLGFAIDTPKETLLAELEKYAQAAETDTANAERNAELDAKHAIADETIAALTGKTVEVAAEALQNN